MAEFDTSSATVTANDILSGKTAYAKGEKLTGAIQSKMGGTFTPSTENQTICPAKVFTSAAFAVKGDANLKPSNIKKDVEIFGVRGTMRGNDAPSGTLPDNVVYISVQSDDPMIGTVSGGGAVSRGMTMTISAEGKTFNQSKFLGWEENGEIVSYDAEYTFEATESRNLTAKFNSTELPVGYTKVDWIQNENKSSYLPLSTDISSSENFTFTFQQISTSSGRILSSTQSSEMKGNYMESYGITLRYFYTYTTSTGVTAYSQFEIGKLSNGSVVDSLHVVNSFGTSCSFYINGAFAGSNSARSITFSNAIIGSKDSEDCPIIRIYAFEIPNRCRFLPCVNPEGIVGMYDTKRKIFAKPVGKFITESSIYWDVILYVGQKGWGTVSGGKTYPDGTQVTVTAAPSSNEYAFSCWRENGEIVSKDASYSFIIDRARFLTAEFIIKPTFKIIASANPFDGGTVAGTGSYLMGTPISLTATPNLGYVFSKWTESGNEIGEQASYPFTVEKNRYLTANFSSVPIYNIDVLADPEGSGSVTGAGQHQKDSTVTLTASANENYKFSSWRENGEIVSESNKYTFTADRDRTLTAKFRQDMLPDGYTQLQYITLGPVASFTATQLAYAHASQTISLDFEVTQFPTNTNSSTTVSAYPMILYSYGTSGSTTQHRDGLWIGSGGIYAQSSAGTITTSNKFLLSNDVTVPQKVHIFWDGPNKQISINDNDPIAFPAYGVGTNWYLGYYTTGSSTAWKSCSINIYRIAIDRVGSDSTSYNKDYVPARRDSNGAIGLYNLLNNNFVTNDGFVAGPITE